MPRQPLQCLLASLVALCAGCVGSDKPEAVRVRRSPEEVARWEAGPGSYAELKEQLKQQDEAMALDGELSRSEAWLKVSKLGIREVAKAPLDPWESYEDERRGVLYRHWTDRFRPPPAVEGEPLPGETPLPSADGPGDSGSGDSGDSAGEGEGDTPPSSDSDQYGY